MVQSCCTCNAAGLDGERVAPPRLPLPRPLLDPASLPPRATFEFAVPFVLPGSSIVEGQ
jgi:hypothetical protein